MQSTRTIFSFLITSCALACAPSGSSSTDAGDVDAPILPDGSVPDVGSDVAVGTDAETPDAGPPPPMADSWLAGPGGAGAHEILGVASDPAGNVMVAGRFEGVLTLGTETLTSNGAHDVLIAKYDANGALQWARSFGGSEVEIVGGIAVDEDSNSYVVGRFSSSMLVGDVARLEPAGQEEVFIASFDGDGAIRWAQRFGGEYSEGAREVAVNAGVVCFAGDYQGGFDIGSTTLTPSFQFDAFAACLTAQHGDVRWARAFAGVDSDIGTAIAVDHEGNALVGISFGSDVDVFGETLSNRGGFDAALVKISAIGEHIYTSHVGASGAEEITGVDVDGEGNVYLAGVFDGQLSFGDHDVRATDAHDVFVASLSPSGDARWATSFGARGFDQPLDLAVGSDRVHVTGRFDGDVDVDGHEITSQGDFDAFLATYDAAGNAIGAWTIGGVGADQANGVAPDPSGGAYVGGYHTDPITMDDITLSSEGRIGAFLAHLAFADIELI